MQYKLVDNELDLAECIKLGEAHYNEVEWRFTGLPYTPNLSLFLQLYEAGLLKTVALYNGTRVVGYVMFSISPSLFSSGVNAQEIGLYISPEYRNSGWFKKMLEYALEKVQEEGATSIHVAFKEGMSHRLPTGFVESETFYVKVLGK